MAEESQKKIRIGDLLVEKGVISETQLKEALKEQKKRAPKIGDMLLERGMITEAQLKEALKEQKKRGQKLGRTLIALGYVTEDAVLDLLARQLQIPFIDLRHYRYDVQTVRRLPESLARRYRCIVLKAEENAFLVGLVDPLDLYAVDGLTTRLGAEVKRAIVREADLNAVLDAVYRRSEEISTLASELKDELAETDFNLADMLEQEGQVNAPVVRLLQTLFEGAVKAAASDIHIEPDEKVLRLRMRIDGALSEQVMPEARIASALTSRLKIMAGLDISERRLPQDGRFNIRVGKKAVDVRLSTLPTQHGESVVMRLLDRSTGLIDLDGLGMPEAILARFRQLVHTPHGMILVTGPTGSGKTTTLYAALGEINRPDVKVITVEDPIEYRLERTQQVQVNSEIGLTFASVLRSALRQDPDIILVGEMRDQETTEIGLRAAMTGHMVLSTLHTNDAITSAIRLLDMGAEGYLIGAALHAIIAQRLVRRVCENCRRPHEPTASEAALIHSLGHGSEHGDGYVHGNGCAFCNNTGYRGRIGVFELLEMNPEMVDAMRREDPSAFAAAAVDSPLFRPFTQVALDYAGQGITSLEEVMRIAGEVAEAPTGAGTAVEDVATGTGDG
ncbi:MAG: GspE/PulE family protein [Gammaproteobacteria bacterium]|nr:GspE/PulE family protein [Gammaproteobacteria bacterium]